MDDYLEEIIDSIKKINSDLDDKDNKAMLSTDDWEPIFGNFNDWVVLHLSSSGPCGMDSYLIPPLEENKINFNSIDLSDRNSSFCDHPDYLDTIHLAKPPLLKPYWGDSFTKASHPFYFKRAYYGYKKHFYIEFNQLIAHSLDLHWIENKKSYCSMNSTGEEIEKIKRIDKSEKGIDLIVIKRQTLDKLLYLGNWVLVRHFQFIRKRKNGDSNAKDEIGSDKTGKTEKHEVSFRVIYTGQDRIEFADFYGWHIRKPTHSKDDVLVDNEEEGHQRYESFIVCDFKNRRVLKDYSIKPENFVPYSSRKSDLPHEMSPIFFDAEVLDKYKNNPCKYQLKNRNITLLPQGWYLKSYDINKYNQVHVYAKYLSHLPYKEQLHWKQYNTDPRGNKLQKIISKEALQTDFFGELSEERPLLDQLRNKLKNLENINFGKHTNIGSIWSLGGKNWEVASEGLFEVHTENPKSLKDFVCSLNNIVNELFQVKSLRMIAKYYANKDLKNPDTEEEGKLNLLKKIIEKVSPEKLSITYKILKDLQNQRSKLSHKNPLAPLQGSLVETSKKQLEEIIAAIENLVDIFLHIKDDINETLHSEKTKND